MNEISKSETCNIPEIMKKIKEIEELVDFCNKHTFEIELKNENLYYVKRYAKKENLNIQTWILKTIKEKVKDNKNLEKYELFYISLIPIIMIFLITVGFMIGISL